MILKENGVKQILTIIKSGLASLKLVTGHSVEMSLDKKSYVLTLTLKNSDGTVLNTQSVDFPMETAFVNAEYDNTDKKIVFTLENGTTIDVPVGDLVNGLVSENDIDTNLSDTSTNPVQNKVIKAELDKKADKEKYGDTIVSVGRKSGSTVGNNSFAFGYKVTASGNYSHAEGYFSNANGTCSYAEGSGATASGNYSHAEGNGNIASGRQSHAEGGLNTASGESSHAEGYCNTASGEISHAEGNETSALGDNSHVEGYRTTALGDSSHVEGTSTNTLPAVISKVTPFELIKRKWDDSKFSLAKGQATHVEGIDCIAYGDQSHAEGYRTLAQGNSSHAEGNQTYARSNSSHVEGFGTEANMVAQHVEGRYNDLSDRKQYVHIVGNGTSDTSRSNAHTVDWDGNAWYAGGMEIEGQTGLTLRDTLSNNNGYPSKVYTKGRALILTAPYDAEPPANEIKDTKDSAGLEIRSCADGIFPISQGNGVTWSPFLNLGDSSRPFGTIYCRNTSSDRKIKKDVENLSESDLADKYVKILDLINFVKFRWKHNMNGGMETPPSSRYHYGIIAQEIEKLLRDIGIGTYDNGIIKADFFAKNTSNAFITGGYREQFENEENGVTYDYSKNTYDFKKGNDYSVYNEILDKELSALNGCNGYTDRSNIGYLMIEDNSKLSEKYEDRPPVTIKGIILIDKAENTKKLSIDFDKCISYYEWDDENLSNPKTSGTLNEDGSVTVSFNKKYSTYMIKVDDFNFFDYERIVLDVDYVGEYKVYLIPNATEEHVNANVYDRDRVDDIMLTYHVDYQELQILCLHALQQKSKKQEKDIADLRKEIEELKGMIKNA